MSTGALGAEIATAQVPAAPPPPPVGIVAPTPEAAMAAPPVLPADIPPPVDPAPSVTVTPTPMTPPAPVPPPPEAAPDYKKINVGFGLRVGAAIQGADRSKLDDVSLDEIYVEPRFSGQLTPMFAWQANFNAQIPTSPNSAGSPGGAAVMDLIAKLDAHDAFHFWVGRMLVPSDRSNFSGSWFMSPWRYPGFYPTLAAPVGPVQGANGRNNGATAWGQFAGGKAKYYVGAFALNEVPDAREFPAPTVSPLYTARLNFCLLGSEPGFYHSSTYYGSQDIVALGLGGQYQKNGSGPMVNPQDLTVGIVDLLAEKNLGATGVVTFEGQYYYFDENQTFKNAFYVLGSFLTPKMGIGKVQPLVRYQQAAPQAGASWKMFDAYVTYVIDDYFLRVAVGYSRADVQVGPTANAIYLGVQMQR